MYSGKGDLQADGIARRKFLKQAGFTVVGTLGLSRVPSLAEKTSNPEALRVRVDRMEDPRVVRAFAILQDRIQLRCPVKVVQSADRARIHLTVDSRLPEEAFRLQAEGQTVQVAGGSPRGLIHGIGKFLRTCRYRPDFEPSDWRGVSHPRGTVRGVYFASHFHNWYVQASEAEVKRYLEDLALWGVNTIMVILPMINLRGWEDPEAEPAMEMVRRYARLGRELGFQFATGINNAMFSDAPTAFRARPLPDPTGRRGNSGHPLCPSNPEAHAYLMGNARELFARLADVGLDLLVHWPYDEGGCACEQCQPWGSNGYLKLSRDFTELGRTCFPNLKAVLSTWMFDTPFEGEWKGLNDTLTRSDRWVDFILADSHEDFPRYPLDVGVPGGLPLLSFPEISMWGNWPWGGYGANPLPARLERLWDQVRHVVQGGFPYSEGIYEDLNKAVIAQFYWDPGRTARDTIQEYSAYEYDPDLTPDVLTLIDLLERAASASYRKAAVDAEAVRTAAQLAESLNSCLPDWSRRGWRWEILRLRASLDLERFAGPGLESPAAEAAMLRLAELYHCQIETDDPYHHRVRPPVRRAVDRAGRK
jgi:hypothetical protein